MSFSASTSGDLKNAETLDHYRTALETQLHLFGITPRMLVCDLHPDYFSTREAQSMAAKRDLPPFAGAAPLGPHGGLHGRQPAGRPRLRHRVGRHRSWAATAASGAASSLRGGYDGFRRAGSIRPVPLPGGDAAVRQIGRIGLALAWDAGVPAEVREALPLLRALPGQTALLAMLEKGIACPGASSIGRLFDGVYALLSGRVDAGYDGQAPALLESLACGEIPGRGLSHSLQPGRGGPPVRHPASGGCRVRRHRGGGVPCRHCKRFYGRSRPDGTGAVPGPQPGPAARGACPAGSF